jgi:transposase
VSTLPGGCVPTLFGASERDDTSSMAARKRPVTGGVDTHGKTHHAAAVDQTGRLLGDQQFPATAAGYRALLAWLRSLGRVAKVGVEGTGTYGAGLARYLAAEGVELVELVEVDRPDRKTRRSKGKSDPIDAVAAARAALSGQAAGAPKTRMGPVEAIRALRVARRGAVKARTAALNQLHGLIASAPEQLRADLAALPAAALVPACAALMVDEAHISDPVQATKAALRVPLVKRFVVAACQIPARLRAAGDADALEPGAVQDVGLAGVGAYFRIAGSAQGRANSRRWVRLPTRTPRSMRSPRSM